MSKLSSWFQKILSWFKSQKTEQKTAPETPKTPTTPEVKPDEPAQQKTGTAWKSYVAPDFFQHGNSNEDNYRNAALSNAKVSGIDCMRCKASFGMSNELAIHLLAYESEVEPGKYLFTDGWFFRSERNYGVTKWIHDLGTPSDSDVTRWMFLTKSPYYKNRLQYVVSSFTTKEVIDKLKTNVQGCEVIVE